MRAVNLLPEEDGPGIVSATFGRGASARRVLSGSGIAAGVLAILFAGLFIHQRGVVDDRRTSLHDVETRLIAAQARAAAVEEGACCKPGSPGGLPDGRLAADRLGGRVA